MKTNEIKKGMLIRLKSGWYGIMADNMRGNTRMVEIHGDFTETGSVYSHDIWFVWPSILLQLNAGKGIPIVESGFKNEIVNVESVEHTKAQLKLKKQVDLF